MLKCKSEVYCIDNLKYMATLPDKAFDLAICDPPYGNAVINANGGGQWNRFGGIFDKYKKNKSCVRGQISAIRENKAEKPKSVSRTGGTWATKYGKHIIDWDISPKKEYFDELFRISKNQIIWGGNYFSLPPTRCFIVWRKLSITEGFSMAMCEYAWTSFNTNAKYFEFAPQGNKEKRIHATQKPIELYAFILRNFAQKGDKIFDPNMESQSSRIACYEMGFDYVGCEIDKDYFDAGCKRFDERCLGEYNTLNGEKWIEQSLF